LSIVDNGASSFNLSDGVLTGIANIPSGGAEPVNSALWYIDDNLYPFKLNGYDDESPFYTKTNTSKCNTDKKTLWNPNQWIGGDASLLPIPIQHIFVDPILGTSSTVTSTSCGNSVLISKSTALSETNANHPLGFQFRVFWDYDHENMVNGAYIDGKIGTWDQYINRKIPNYPVTGASAYSAFGNNDARKNYVAIATKYNGYSFVNANHPDVTLYNPLTLEPLFNVLEGDLNKISNDSTN
jgi:hypothetical protein